MDKQNRLSGPAACAIAALALLGLAGRWLILLSGGFQHQLQRYGSETTTVTGLPAISMAAIMFAQAALATLALLRDRGAGPFWQVALCGAVLAPPAWFVAAG